MARGQAAAYLQSGTGREVIRGFGLAADLPKRDALKAVLGEETLSRVEDRPDAGLLGKAARSPVHHTAALRDRIHQGLRR